MFWICAIYLSERALIGCEDDSGQRSESRTFSYAIPPIPLQPWPAARSAAPSDLAYTCIVHPLPPPQARRSYAPNYPTLPPPRTRARTYFALTIASLASLTYVSTIPILSACPNALPQLGHFLFRFPIKSLTHSLQNTCPHNLSAVLRMLALQTGQMATFCLHTLRQYMFL